MIIKYENKMKVTIKYDAVKQHAVLYRPTYIFLWNICPTEYIRLVEGRMIQINK